MARSPLFDLYDPYGILAQQAESGMLPDPNDPYGLAERKPVISDLMPEEEKSGMLRSLAAAGSSGLAGLGWLLDTPGAVVRGALAEGPIKGLSALWETSDDRITGRELLRSYGAAGNEDNWSNFGTGLATELLLDPLTYASFGLNAVLGKGAKTAAGQLAQKANLLDDFDLYARNTRGMGTRETLRNTNINDLLNNITDVTARTDAERRLADAAGTADIGSLMAEPLARMNRVGLPFGKQGAADLYGSRVGDFVARTADRFGDNLATNVYTGPVVRGFTKAFDPNVLDMYDYDRQWDARGIKAAEVQRGVADNTMLSRLQYDAEQALGRAGTSLNDPVVSQSLRRALTAADPALLSNPELRGLYDFFDNYRVQARSTAADLGLDLPETVSHFDDVGFFPRQQVRFDAPELPQWPDGVTPPDRVKGAYTKGSRAVPLDDNLNRSRRDYTDVLGADDTLNAMSLDAGLQDVLRRTTVGGARNAIEVWAGRRGLGDLFPWEADDAAKDALYGRLGDFVSTLDPQHARKGVPVFGQNSFNEMARYVTGRGRVESNAAQMLDLLRRNAEQVPADDVLGRVNYNAQEALNKLRFTGTTAEDVLARTLGVDSLDAISFNKKFVDDFTRVVERGRVDPNISPLLEKYDNFTKSFKTLALLWPARYSRDLYSGAFAAGMKGSFNPVDWNVGRQIRNGNYTGLLQRIKDLPAFRDLSDEEKIRKFLTEAGGQGLGTSTVADELMTGANNTQLREMYPGGARPTWRDIGRKVYNPARSWPDAARDFNPFAVRSASGNRNPLLELGDRAAETTDAMNRYGTYLNQIRKGAAPGEARRIADLTQVNYRPEAFTNIERDVLKRIFPFYSYTRGIAPLIADELVNNPAGLMGLSTRAITRGSEPSQENFVPEYLRQSASIPVPSGLPFVSLDPGSNLKRFLTNIDLPFESAINLVTPGVGTTLFDKVGSTIQKTALNVLGQSNPLLKGPAELATNRQFFSGRQLSDLYSMLEQPFGSPGRVAEQVISNLPGGSRVLGTTRQLMDDRLTPAEKYSKLLVNALTGLKFQDVDQERTKRLAARDMLNQLLSTAPGVRTYENVTVPEDVLRAMPKDQKDMYLLYKIIQSEAAKRAREKKKQAAALDPLQMLGVINQF